MFIKKGDNLHEKMGNEGESSGGAASKDAGESGGALFDDAGDNGGGAGTGEEKPSGDGGSGEGGGSKISIPENWKDSLPDELKTATFLKDISTVENLAKSYANAQKMIGAEKIPVPGKHSSEEDWAGVYKKLGLVDKVEDYALDINKDIKIADAFMDGLKPILHKNGILPHQAKELVEWFAKTDSDVHSAQMEAMKEKQMADLMGLKKEWGDSYGEEVAKAKAALNEFATDEERETIRNSGLGSNVNLIRLLAKAGNTLSEDKILEGGGSAHGMPTPAQARLETKDIMSDKEHPYWNPEKAGHQEAKRKMEQLFKISASGKA